MADKPVTWWVDEQVKKGKWREEEVSPMALGLGRPQLKVFRARRKSNLIKHRDHSDSETVCPRNWYDLAIGSGPCGLQCRGCFLINTFRIKRDPHRHVLYENVEDFEWEVRRWLHRPERKRAHVLGLGIDCSDSLLYEVVTEHARRLIPLFASEETNPKGCKLLLLTKSSNAHYLEGLPTENVIYSISLNPAKVAQVWEGLWAQDALIAPMWSRIVNANIAAVEYGFEMRWRLDPIIPIPGWQEIYHHFFEGFSYPPEYTYKPMAIPSRITLGLFRATNLKNLDHWRKRWGLPPMGWWPEEEMLKEGTHYRLPETQRIEIYSTIAAMIGEWDDSVQIGLCKETRAVRKATGLTGPCNCMR